MINTSLHKSSLRQITKALIKKAIFVAYKDGITSVAPLGFSGDDILLFGDKVDGRKSVVQLRNYCNNVELLITDIKGNFLFYGRYEINLGIDFVAEQYFTIFKLVKSKIETDLPQVSDFTKVLITKKEKQLN